MKTAEAINNHVDTEQPNLAFKILSQLGILGVIAVVVLALVCLIAIFAPWLAPHDPLEIDIINTYGVPSEVNLLGTDALGRDILSRLIWGSRTALLGPLAIVFLSGTVAMIMSMIAAWNRGFVDILISRVIDIQFAFPAILLTLLITATFSSGFWPAVVALSLASVPHKARLLRSTPCCGSGPSLILKRWNRRACRALESASCICYRQSGPSSQRSSSSHLDMQPSNSPPFRSSALAFRHLLPIGV
ncbi:ABC transporter permease [Ochrobactrum haematophilum]|uniref:ABC transporter permease n=1 Tax=Brucella haematophila TaxID=419474 RepID=A0ABX1DTZ2_9HYPH|nr:ABC transporter permease [Brucella haematophila]